MRKRPRVSLSLIVAETARSDQARRITPPFLKLVVPTGGDVPQRPEDACSDEERTELIWAPVEHGLETIQDFSRCRDWVEVLGVQQRWAERTQADYASAWALLTGAAISVMAGAAASLAAATEPCQPASFAAISATWRP
jgi:hypothetical protein